MIGSIQPNFDNPTIRYRLDPGEPGVANPAKATTSVYTVVGQESRNRARLESEALREGRQVLLVKTDYKVRQEGSFSVVVGGLTTVVTRNRPERSTALEQGSQLEVAQPAAEPEARPGGQPAAATEESEQSIRELQAEEGRLEEEIQRLERDARTGSGYVAAQAEQGMTRAENRLREIEEELRTLRAGAGNPTQGGGTGLARVGQAAQGLNVAVEAAGQLVDFLV
jgi:hypothetical protein